METPLNELLEWINEAEKNHIYSIGTQNTKRLIEKLVEKEKQVIIEAWIDGMNNSDFGNKTKPQQYYKETFKSE